MPLNPSWEDIAIRLALTIVAGALIGFNREAHGHAAGLRTTMLVCLTASIAMILANELLGVAGKTTESFVRMDVMRLPLGVLTGVGFIGGGVIFRRTTLVTGVTTAATLWVVTVIGLCFGAGEIGLGAAATILTLITLWALKWIDIHTPRVHRATITIRTRDVGPSADDVRAIAKPLGCRVQFRDRLIAPSAEGSVIRFDLRWRARQDSDPPVDVLERVQQKFPGSSAEWKSQVTD